MFKFEKLSVWQKAMALADEIYKQTRTFPADERFGLTNQLRRAAVSVASNIAEGSARSDPDFSRFIGIASGSLYELITQATLAKNQGWLSAEEHHRLYQSAEEIARMLTGLRESISHSPKPSSGSGL